MRQWEWFCRRCGREHDGNVVDDLCLRCAGDELEMLRGRVKAYEREERKRSEYREKDER